jgi:hypothetical protein
MYGSIRLVFQVLVVNPVAALVLVLLGGGVRLFEHLGTPPIRLERTHVVEAPGVTHFHFCVLK